jgi:hypothetical protein
MSRWIWRMRRRKGNVTTMWIAGLPVFMIVFMFLASLVIAWMDVGISQKAADAGSLAVTKKMDELVNQEIDARLVAAVERKSPNPYDEVLGTPGQKNGLVEYVISSKEKELIEAAQRYLRKNGAAPHGVITFFVDGRIQVEAKIPFKPMIFEDEFKGTYVKGRGTGPVREYGKWLKKRMEIEF